MNILPKKSWHVRTKKNIERVRRDEAEAERLAQIEQKRRLEVEKEARIRELRARTGLKEPEALGHINLFERQDRNQESNKDHDKEKQEEEAKWQQRAGLLNKLGRSEDVNKPWYCIEKSGMNPSTGTSSRVNLYTNKNDEEAKRRAIARSNLISSIYDPLTAMEDAERIVRAKRAQQKEQERLKQFDGHRDHLTNLRDYDFYRLTQPPKLPSSRQQPMLKHNESGIKATQPVTRESDSSPEIIKIVRAGPKKERCSKKTEKRKSKKEKSSSKHKHHRHKKDKKKRSKK